MNHGIRTMLMATAFLALQAACQRGEDANQALQGAADDEAQAQSESQARTDEALARADSDYQIALRRCDMLAADQQSSCREEAQTMLEAARRAAEGPPGPS